MRFEPLTTFTAACVLSCFAAFQGGTTTDKPQAKPQAKPQDKPQAKPQDKPQDKPVGATDEDFKKLLMPYLSEGLLGRIGVAAKIAKMSEDDLANRALPLLTGERNRLILQVKTLVEALGDVRYDVREKSESALVAMGPLVLPIAESMRDQSDFEISIRLGRVIEKLKQAGTEDIVRKALLARGLAEALEYRHGELETRALISALDSLDSRVRIAAVRSLGTILGDAKLAATFGDKVIGRIEADVNSQDLDMRNAATATIGTMPIDRARDFLTGIVRDGKRSTSQRLLALRLLDARVDATALLAVAKELPEGSELIGQAAAYYAKAEETAEPGEPIDLVLELKDGGKLAKTSITGMSGDKILFRGPADFDGLDTLRIPRSSVDQISVPSGATANAVPAAPGVHVLLKSGTRLVATELVMTADSIEASALGRKLILPRRTVRGIVPDPKRGRALGGSRNNDQVRLLTGEKKTLEGRITNLTDAGVTLRGKDKKDRTLPWKDVQVALFQLESGRAASQGAGDINQYVQVDLTTGERVVGMLLGISSRNIGLASRSLGCFGVELKRVATMQLSNSGRALTGFTLVTDYGNTRVVEYDGEGREVWKLEDLFDPLDAELTPGGMILVTEQGDNAVREYDREGNVKWEFTDLSRPLDGDRLPNGNTLITDPGNFRVIEVDPKGKIVWTFGRKEAKNPQFKPYDADRLPNGNTLVADYVGEQVLEVTPAGKVAWSYRGTKYVCDADRLPNGNTLITMRQPAQVLEVTPAHTVVWKLTKLQLPWDADRLPDGTTMVSENFGVRIYSREGKPLKKLEAEWASEANGY